LFLFLLNLLINFTGRVSFFWVDPTFFFTKKLKRITKNILMVDKKKTFLFLLDNQNE